MCISSFPLKQCQNYTKMVSFLDKRELEWSWSRRSKNYKSGIQKETVEIKQQSFTTWKRRKGTKKGGKRFNLIFLNFFFAAGLRSDPLHSPPLGLLTLIASRPLEVFSDTNSTSSFSPRDRNPDIWMTDWNGKTKL